MASPNVESRLSSLTLEEKISLLSGGDFWRTVTIRDKGIPNIKTTDGPNGARGGKITGGVPAACFPAACSIASTFDLDLARRVGVALGEETLTKGARCLLSPTACIHRHPLGGRNFESFSEDPFLSGYMGIASVTGLQSTGVSSSVKHYAANEQETQRMRLNAVIAQRPLREIYLKPFELIAKKAKPWAVMTAYTKVNGEHVEANEFLLKQVLRGEWKWDGLVMSDWGGVNTTAAALNAGLDLEMPGPTFWRKTADVLAALKAGEVTEQVIDERSRRVLGFLQQLGCFDNPKWDEDGEIAVNRPEHAALIREAGAKGIVLLKNSNQTLPLTRDKLRGKKVALLGYAKECLAHGGGSASLVPHYKVTPWDALNKTFEGDDVEFTYAKGAHTFRHLPPLIDNVHDLQGNPGFTGKIRYPDDPSMPDVIISGYAKSEISFFDGHALQNSEVELVGVFCPQETATYYLTLSSLGPSKLTLDGEVILEQRESCIDAMGFLFGGVPVPRTGVHLEQGKEYKIQISSSRLAHGQEGGIRFIEGQVGVRVGCMSSIKHDVDLVSDAVELAKAADYSIIFTGNDPAWETEGQDQVTFNLPRDGSQDKLVAAVAAACPKTIVVNSTGSAVALPWLDQVDALLQAWFPGQEAGNAIADILTGARNPEGHLTCTFPKRIEDCSAYGNFPGKEHATHGFEVTYAEGVFVGYRHFDRLPPGSVHFPFGFGLSYTTFNIADVSVAEGPEDTCIVQARVSNTGQVTGAIALQVYVGERDPSPSNPVKVLAAFKKVALEPGTDLAVKISVDMRDFAIWDEEKYGWVVEEGDYIFSVGRSSGDLAAATTVASIRGRSFAP